MENRMSDPANILIRNQATGDNLVTIYVHNIGDEFRNLAYWLSKFTVGNGIPFGIDTKYFANGAGCLAAKVVAKLKDLNDAGGVYLEKSAGESLLYIIEVGRDNIDIVVYYGDGDIIFSGTPEEYVKSGHKIVEEKRNEL